MKNLKFTVIDKKKLKNIKGGLPFREAAPFLGRFKVENKSKCLSGSLPVINTKYWRR